MAAKTSGVCERLRAALTSLCCESAIVTLTLVSGLAITGEILISYGILTGPSSSKTSPQEGGNNSSNSADPGGGLSSSSSSGDEQHAQTMEIVEKVFHYTSMVVAGIFFVEIMLKLLVFRLAFLTQHWQILDMLIVFASVMVEVSFEIEDTMRELEAATFIVIFRLWRIPQACNLKARSVQRALEQDIEVWKAGKKKLEEKCQDMEVKNNKQKEKIERLERDLSSLKKDTKEGRYAKHTAPPPTPVASRNGTVPRDNTDAPVNAERQKSSNRDNTTQPKEAAKPQTSERITVAADEDTPDFSPVAGRFNQTELEDRDLEDDAAHDRDSGEIGQGQRMYFRSGSESSLSCQALEHEVHVQIEEPSREPSGGEEWNDNVNEREGDNSASVLLRTKGNLQEENKRLSKSGRAQQVCYDNAGYSPDGEEGEIQGVLVHEIDGARTYRSAEGIPMTSL